MNTVNIGLALDIAGPVMMLALIITGAVKAWSYRRTDKEGFIAIYKPYKYWGFGIWILFNLAGLLLIITS